MCKCLQSEEARVLRQQLLESLSQPQLLEWLPEEAQSPRYVLAPHPVLFCVAGFLLGACLGTLAVTVLAALLLD